MPKSDRRIFLKRKSLADVDKGFLTLFFTLLIFGIFMIYNATGIYSQGTFGGAYRFTILHLGWISIGFLGFLFFFKMDYEKLKVISLPLFIIASFFLFLLSSVSLISSCETTSFVFSPCINGAFRWFYLNPPPFPEIPFLGVLGFQPSEFAKLAMILYLGVLLEKHVKEKKEPFMVFMVIVGITSLLILLQPNMSTAALLVTIGVSMYFVSGGSLKPLLISLPILLVSGIGFILTSSYRRARLTTFMNLDNAGELSFGYHIRQVLIALGSGGIFGVGFGQSRQKYQYLPEVASDSIFAIVGEEFGFIGTTLFVLIFSAFIYKGFMIAKSSSNLFGRMVATGVTTWLAFQFFVNIAAMTKIIPLTGIPLPLVSYGGSSLVFTMMGIGLLANISAHES